MIRNFLLKNAYMYIKNSKYLYFFIDSIYLIMSVLFVSRWKWIEYSIALTKYFIVDHYLRGEQEEYQTKTNTENISCLYMDKMSHRKYYRYIQILFFLQYSFPCSLLSIFVEISKTACFNLTVNFKQQTVITYNNRHC